MADQLLKIFREDWFRRFQKYLFILLFVPTSITVQYGMVVSGLNDYSKKDYWEFCLAIFFFFLMFLLEYISIVLIGEFKNTAATVEVYTDRIVGHAQYKKNIWILYYTDIKKIYPRGKVVRPSITLEDVAGNKYNISIYFDFLQECVEYIKHQSTNLEVYELGNIPKNKIEWKKSDNPII